MSSISHVYVFDIFELDQQAGTVQAGDELINLTNAEYLLLLYFVKHPKLRHSYGDLYEEVFGLEGKSQENTIPAHVSNLRRKLRAFSEKQLIKNIPSFGYRFEADVSIKEKSGLPPVIEPEIATDDRQKIENEVFILNNDNFDEADKDSESDFKDEESGKKRRLVFSGGVALAIIFLAVGAFSLDYTEIFEGKIAFIAIAAISYGILNAIGLILECAYEFDKYRSNAGKMAISVFLINAGAVFSGFILTDKFLHKGYLSAFWAGFVFLLLAALLSCFSARFVLPNVPIAKARIQTQPAFTAFCKNVFLYFLPLWSFFGLLIFCLIYGNWQASKNITFAFVFIFIWLVSMAGSLYSTFYFTSKLLTERGGEKYKYYSLYFSLLMARAALFFGPPAAAVILYLIFVLN